MKNRSFAYSLVLLIALLICAASLSSCDRQPYPLGNVEDPKTVPEYDVGVDINKSPAVVASPVS
jgi:hypothetical protein